jgi:Domain of unknown function (DUF3362)
LTCHVLLPFTAGIHLPRDAISGYSDLYAEGQRYRNLPFDTGLDSFTGQGVHVARHLGDRMVQRALLQFFKPENDFEVGKALLEAGRQDLIGSGCGTLMPAQPPAEEGNEGANPGRRAEPRE